MGRRVPPRREGPDANLERGRNISGNQVVPPPHGQGVHGGPVADPIQTHHRPPRPWLTLALSLLFPGLGHIHAGRICRGLGAWAVSVVVLVVGFYWTFGTPVGLVATVLAAILLDVGIAWDARRCALAGPPPGPRWWLRWALVLPLYAFEETLMPALVPDGPEAVARWLPNARYRFGLAQFNSMEPVLGAGDRFVYDVRAYRSTGPARGEVVLFEAPEDLGPAYWVKRVLAGPGDRVEIRGQALWVNGAAAGACPGTANLGPLDVPSGHLFLLGDNRAVSYDSRAWGPLPVSMVKGKVLYVAWPAGGGWGRFLTRLGYQSSATG